MMFATGDVSGVADTVAANYVDHQDRLHGRQGFVEVVAGARSGYDALHVEIQDVIEASDRVAVRLRWTGHRPSGDTDVRETIDIVRVAGGLAVEHWGARS